MTDYDKRRHRQREETEQRILEAAIKLFGENGYAKTTIKEVAEEAGVANGLVGKYFSTKDILLSEAYRHATAYAYPLDLRYSTSRQALKMLVEYTVDVYKRKSEYYLFFRMLINATDLPQEYWDARSEFFENTSLCSHIHDERYKGTISGEDSYEFFMQFMRMVYNIVEIYCQMPHGGDINLAKRTIDLVVDTVDERLKEFELL